MRPTFFFALLLVAGAACGPKVATPSMNRAECRQEITDIFGPQKYALVAVRSRNKQPLFNPDTLEALDRVCAAFEDASIDDMRSVKCLTTVPIMYTSAMGTRVMIAREEFPFSAEQCVDFHNLVLQLEFARGDVLDPGAGDMATFIHLPLEIFEQGTIEQVFAEQSEAEASTLAMQLDTGTGKTTPAYQRHAAGGPSSAAVFGLYDSGRDGGLKEPSTLLAIERFQVAAEALPGVAQTFTIADVVKLVRRGQRRGVVREALIPPVRSEISQLLLALSMSPNDGGFGPTMDSQERVALLRVNLTAVNAEQRRKTGKSLERLLLQQLQPEARAFLCLDR